MSNTVKGTFTTTGQSDELIMSKGVVVLDFAGTATVALQVREEQGGGWINVEAGYTADKIKTVDGGAPLAYRLDCSAHTNNVTYTMKRDH